jgi:MFS family permease
MNRKYTIQLGAIIWMIGAAIQCSVQNVAQLICGRLIAGVAIGICSSQVPVYIAELSPKQIRGRLVGLFQWAVTWGIMYVPHHVIFHIYFMLNIVGSCSTSHTVARFWMVLSRSALPGAFK